MCIRDSCKVTAALYRPLFTVDQPDTVEDWESVMEPNSRTLVDAVAEPSLEGATGHFQFERLGYFAPDPDRPSLFHRVVELKSGWGKKPAAKPPAPRKREVSQPAVVADYRPSEPTQAARFDTLVGAEISEPIAGVLATRADLDALYSAALSEGAPAVFLANLVVSELGSREDLGALTAPALAHLARLSEGDAINSRATREVLEVLVRQGGEPEAIVDELGLRQVSDEDALAAIVDAVLQEFPDRVAAYRGGRKGLKGFFMGQVMKRSGGSANPRLVQGLLAARLD